jgi:hypothetical protein
MLKETLFDFERREIPVRGCPPIFAEHHQGEPPRLGAYPFCPLRDADDRQHHKVGPVCRILYHAPESHPWGEFWVVVKHDTETGDVAGRIVGAAEARDFQRKIPAEPAAGEPPKYLTSWREILIALGFRNNAEDRGKVKHLNNQYQGPIVIPKQGAQPKVNEAKLREWYDHLEAQWTVGHRPARDAQPTTAAQHPYGRNGTVAPEISGRVKVRRKDRRA